MAGEGFTITKRGLGAQGSQGSTSQGIDDKYDAILSGETAPNENVGMANPDAIPSQAALDRLREGQKTQDSGVPAADYAHMSWGEYAPILASNALPSAWEAVKGVGSAVAHPIDTATAVGKLGYGLGSKGIDAASEALTGEPVFDPATKGEREAVADALIGSYKGRYGGGEEGEFWKHLAEDPASYLTDAATLLTAGAGTASKLGVISKAGKLARAAELAANIDPMQAALKTAGTILPKAGEVIPAALAKAQSLTSGVPAEYLRGVYQLGKSGSREDIDTFLKSMHGNPSFNGDIADAFDRGVSELGDQASNNYMRQASSALSQRTEVNLAASTNAVDDINRMINPSTVVARRSYFPAGDADKAQHAVDLFMDHATHANPNARTIKELDITKKELDRIANDISDYALKTRVQALAGSLVQDMGRVDPTYLDMMEDWAKYKNKVNDIRRDLGNPNLSNAQRAKKVAKAAAGSAADEVFAALENTPSGKGLRPAIYGSAVNPWLSDATHSILAGGGLFSLPFLPHPAMKLGAIAGAINTSPRIAGVAQYNLGRATSGANKAADLMARYGLNPVVTNAANQLSSAMYPSGEPLDAAREGRKSGGRVSSHEVAADRLVRAAERAKKGQSAHTEALLNQSDDAVASALEVANRSI